MMIRFIGNQPEWWLTIDRFALQQESSIDLFFDVVSIPALGNSILYYDGVVLLVF